MKTSDTIRGFPLVACTVFVFCLFGLILFGTTRQKHQARKALQECEALIQELPVLEGTSEGAISKGDYAREDWIPKTECPSLVVNNMEECRGWLEHKQWVIGVYIGIWQEEQERVEYLIEAMEQCNCRINAPIWIGEYTDHNFAEEEK